MTTLENRPNTALIVIDVQNGVVEGSHQRDAVVANVGNLVEKARKEQVPVVWVQHSSEELVKGTDNWKIVPELSPSARRAAHPQELRRLVRGHRSRVGVVGPGGRQARRRRGAVGCMRPLDVARRVRPGLRRDPGRRRPHDRRSDRNGARRRPDQVIAHTNLYWKFTTAPGREAGTVETKDVDFGA